MSSTAEAGLQTRPRQTIGARAAGPGSWSRRGGRARLEAWLASEKHSLAHWIPVGLGLGIAGYFVLPGPGQWLALMASAAAAALFGIRAGGYVGRVLLAGGLLVALGLGIAWLRAESVGAPRLERPLFNLTLTGTVEAVERRSDNVRLRLRPDDPGLPTRVRLSLRRPPDAAVRPGARISLRATLRPPPGPSLPGGFDLSRRAWFEGMGATGYVLGDIRLVTPAPPPSGPIAALAGFRTRLTARLQQAVGGPAGGIAAAFVTGDVGGIPETTADAMRDSGLSHLLSISGLHIAIVVGGTMLLARRLLTLSMRLALRWPVKIIAASTAALVGIAYTLLAGAQVPTVRSCITALIVLAGMCLGRQAISLRLIATAATLILVVRPEALLGASFQLSFAAVTGLVAAFQSPLGRRLLALPDDPTLMTRLRHQLLGLVLSGLVAESMLAPIALYHFNRSGLYGTLANLVAIPLTSFVIMPGLVLALILDIGGMAAPAFWLVRQAMDLLILLAEKVSSWPGAVYRVPTMPVAAFACFVLGMLWLCLWQGRARLYGLLGPFLTLAIASQSRAPDLVVSGDGRHVGFLSEHATMAMLRPRVGAFLRDVWGDAAAAESIVAFDDLPNTACSRDACVALLAPAVARQEGRTGRLRLLATRSDRLIDRAEFEPACRAADIVVSERRLPPWCAPRWLKLDRTTLERTGSVALWLGPVRTRTVADLQGRHPWAAQAARER